MKRYEKYGRNPSCGGGGGKLCKKCNYWNK
jgi:hypothetical protein